MANCPKIVQKYNNNNNKIVKVLEFQTNLVATVVLSDPAGLDFINH